MMSTSNEFQKEMIEECAICLDVINRLDSGELACKHSFCFGCIEAWSVKDAICPLCRAKFHYILRKEPEDPQNPLTMKVKKVLVTSNHIERRGRQWRTAERSRGTRIPARRRERSLQLLAASTNSLIPSFPSRLVRLAEPQFQSSSFQEFGQYFLPQNRFPLIEASASTYNYYFNPSPDVGFQLQHQHNSRLDVDEGFQQEIIEILATLDVAEGISNSSSGSLSEPSEVWIDELERVFEVSLESNHGASISQSQLRFHYERETSYRRSTQTGSLTRSIPLIDLTGNDDNDNDSIIMSSSGSHRYSSHQVPSLIGAKRSRDSF